MNNWVYISNALGWVMTGVAVSVAIYISGSVASLWFMVVPALVSLATTGNKRGVK